MAKDICRIGQACMGGFMRKEILRCWFTFVFFFFIFIFWGEGRGGPSYTKGNGKQLYDFLFASFDEEAL